MDSDFNYASFEFVGLIFLDQSRDLVGTLPLGPCGHETPRGEPFSDLYLVHLLKIDGWNH